MEKIQLDNFKQMDTKYGTTDIPACFDALVKCRYSLTSIQRYVVKLKKYSTFLIYFTFLMDTKSGYIKI